MLTKVKLKRNNSQEENKGVSNQNLNCEVIQYNFKDKAFIALWFLSSFEMNTNFQL